MSYIRQFWANLGVRVLTIEIWRLGLQLLIQKIVTYNELDRKEWVDAIEEITRLGLAMIEFPIRSQAGIVKA